MALAANQPLEPVHLGPVDYLIEVIHGAVLRPVMVRLADEGVPVSAIARAMQVPSAAVHETIGAALQAARLLESPPTDWPPGQPASRRAGRRVVYDESELTTALQHRYDITRQQALLLVVMLKRPRATKEVLHAAAQAVHAPGHETSHKLVDVVICKLRKRMKRWGYEVHTIWAGGYFLSLDDRKEILKAVGLTLPDVNPDYAAPIKVPVTSKPRR